MPALPNTGRAAKRWAMRRVADPGRPATIQLPGARLTAAAATLPGNTIGALRVAAGEREVAPWLAAGRIALKSAHRQHRATATSGRCGMAITGIASNLTDGCPFRQLS